MEGKALGGSGRGPVLHFALIYVHKNPPLIDAAGEAVSFEIEQGAADGFALNSDCTRNICDRCRKIMIDASVHIAARDDERMPDKIF